MQQGLKYTTWIKLKYMDKGISLFLNAKKVPYQKCHLYICLDFQQTAIEPVLAAGGAVDKNGNREVRKSAKN